MPKDILRHEEHLNRKKIRFLAVLSFVLGFLDAFFVYVISSYFVAVGGTTNVGGFYVIAFGVILWALLTLGRLMQRFGQIRLLLLTLMVLVGSAAFLSLREPSWVGAALLLVFLIMNNVMWVVLDIVLESYSTDRLSGRVRGLYLTIMNAGFLCAPLLSTLILERFGYGGVFSVLTIGYALVLTAVLIGLRKDEREKVPALHLGATWQKLKERRNLLRIYHISFAMEFFYAIMLVYTPIYLTTVVGFRWEELGIIFTVMLIPFVIFQYPLGVLADTRWGEKEFLFLALFVIALGTGLVAWLDTSSVLVWGAALFLTRVGTAAIEILRDSYFYKQIDGREHDLIAFFRTARPIANIVGAIGALFLLSFFPLGSVFFLVVLVALSAAFSSYFLEDTQSERERSLPAHFPG